MKSLKMNGLSRLLAFVLIAVILISVISIAVGGKQSTPDNEPDSGDIGASTDETDENTDGTTNTDQNTDRPTEPEDNIVEPPKFYSPVTGLEVTEDELNNSPLAFLVDTAAPLYGISGADITIELPLENGRTRLLIFKTKTDTLWKIGSLAPARDFISSLTNLFGGTVVSYGRDDIIRYDAEDHTDDTLDLSKISGSYNVENAKYVYSGIERIKDAMDKSSKTNYSSYASMPFILSDTEITGTSSATAITLPYSENFGTDLYYSERTGSYTLYKSSQKAIDKLSGTDVTYKNVFVLFANSTTYETSDGKELVIDTYSGGSGYYASNGQMTEISWQINEDGSLLFKTLSGDVLEVNKGNSYIAYYKTSVSSDVVFR